MNITSEKFNTLDAGYAMLAKVYTHEVIRLSLLQDRMADFSYKYTTEQADLWYSQAKEINTYYSDDLFDEVVEEINSNVVNIAGDGQVKRYLEYIKQKLIVTKELTEGLLDYNKLNEQRVKMLCYNTAKNGGVDDDLHVLNPITDLRIAYLGVVNDLERVMECIDEHLTPQQNPVFESDILKNTHKLLLLHKTGVFEAVYTKYYQHLGSVKFSRLIATMIGVEPDKHDGFRPSVNDMIKEMLSPGSKKVIQTSSAEGKVNAFLSEIGLTNQA